MSVINKMLRDLDQRQTGLASGAGVLTPGESGVLGTLPVTTLPRLQQRAGQPRVMWLVLLLVAAGMVGWGYWQLGQHSTTLSVQAVGVPVAQPAASLSARAPLADVPADAGVVHRVAAAVPAPAGRPASSLATAPKPPETVLTESKMAVKGGDTQPSMPRGSLQNLGTPKEVPAVVAAADAAPGTLRMESSLLRLPASPSVPPKAPDQTTASRSAPLEVMAQAQSLWNAGSHTAATELLGQALSRLEGAVPSGMPVASQSPLASLARELARMQLAEGQVSQALVLLKRLEPQLAQVSDVWALRGNAAQRLGQHAEAAQSYQKALVFRPDEPRWMLGAAVSLAAQGQIAAAGELAEQARAMGALRPDVANYLRQLGVVIRAD